MSNVFLVCHSISNYRHMYLQVGPFCFILDTHKEWFDFDDAPQYCTVDEAISRWELQDNLKRLEDVVTKGKTDGWFKTKGADFVTVSLQCISLSPLAFWPTCENPLAHSVLQRVQLFSA